MRSFHAPYHRHPSSFKTPCIALLHLIAGLTPALLLKEARTVSREERYKS